MSERRIEQVFSSIEEGNRHEADDRHWEAAQAFFDAQALLWEQLATPDAATSDEDKKVDHPTTEDPRIVELYRTQAHEYLFRARTTLLEALRRFAAQERGDDVPTTATTTISDDEAASPVSPREQLEMFVNLFRYDSVLASFQQAVEATPLQSEDDPVVDVAAEGEHDIVVAPDVTVEAGDAASAELPVAPVDDAAARGGVADDLEARLRQLNQSLPPELKTDDERMSDIHKGLNRLGLSLPGVGKKSPGSSFVNQSVAWEAGAAHQSEDDQIDEIMAQARDEVALAAHLTATSGIPINTTTATTSSSEVLAAAAATALTDIDAAEEEQELDDDLKGDDVDDLTPEEIRLIRDQVNETQSALAQLNALLGAGVAADDATDGNQDKEEVDFDQAAAKKALQQARLHLRSAAKKWRDSVC